MPDANNFDLPTDTKDNYKQAAMSIEPRKPISGMARSERYEPSVTSPSTPPTTRQRQSNAAAKTSSPAVQRHRNVQTSSFTLSTSTNDLSGNFHGLSETVNRSPELSKLWKPAKDDVQKSSGLKSLEDSQHVEKSKTKHSSESSSSQTLKVASRRRGMVRVSPFVVNSIVLLVMAVTFVGILILISVLLLTSFYQKSPSLEEKIDDKFKQLKSDFPTQQSKFKLLRTAVKAIALREPKQPAVIVLFASSGAEKTTSCFARVLAESIESMFDENKKFIHKLGHDLSTKKVKAAVIKEDLDEAVRVGFNNGSRVFLLENFNVIPGESAMIFHGLCDDTDAPFKKVLYLFTENLIDFGIKSFSKDIQLKTFEVTKGWTGEIHENQLSSLESRIGAYKMLIEPEENLKSLKEKWNC